MSTAALARAAGIPPTSIAAYEDEQERPSVEVLRRILSAARTRPSVPLAVCVDDILAVARRHGIREVRVFGSAVRGTDTEASDIDLLVDLEPGVDLFDLAAFVVAVEKMTGFPVDVLTDDQLDDEPFAHVRDEAVPL
jgi:hypothetical protein